MAGGTIFSIVLHTVLIAGAVYATAAAGVKDEKAKAEKIQFVEMKKEPVVKKDEPPPPKEVIVKPPPPKGFQVLRAPLRIDIKIPDHQPTRRFQHRLRLRETCRVSGIFQVVVASLLLLSQLPAQRRLAALTRPEDQRHRTVLEPGDHSFHKLRTGNHRCH